MAVRLFPGYGFVQTDLGTVRLLPGWGYLGAPASGPAPAVLEAGHGVFTLAGQAIDFEMAGKLVAAAGAFLLTGQAVRLVRGLRLVAQAGIFSLAGQDAGLVHEIPGGTLATKPFKNNTGLLLTSQAGLRVVVLDLAAPALSVAVAFTEQSTHASTAVLSVTDPAIEPGTPYGLVTVDEDGTVIGADIIVAT